MKPFEVEILEKSIEQKGNMLSNCYDEELHKSWSSDLQKRFSSGGWRTMNGAKVFVNGGKVVAGLDGFNGEIDKFFSEKAKIKEGKKKEGGNIPKYMLDNVKEAKRLVSHYKEKGDNGRLETANRNLKLAENAISKYKEQVGSGDITIEGGKKEEPKKEVKKDGLFNNKGAGKYIVAGGYVFESKDMRDGIDYFLDNKGYLIGENKTGRRLVKGSEYMGNGKPEDAIKLLETMSSLKNPEKKPQSQVLDLAFDELKIPIQEFKGAIEIDGHRKRMPEYWGYGFDQYRDDVREYLDQLPKLSRAVDDKTIKKWYNETIISHVKKRETPDEIGLFVNDEKVTDAIKYWKNKGN